MPKIGKRNKNTAPYLHYFWWQYPDAHLSEKLDTDLDPDPLLFKSKFRSFRGSWSHGGIVDAPS
jgi:hypothetical protein